MGQASWNAEWRVDRMPPAFVDRPGTARGYVPHSAGARVHPARNPTAVGTIPPWLSRSWWRNHVSILQRSRHAYRVHPPFATDIRGWGRNRHRGTVPTTLEGGVRFRLRAPMRPRCCIHDHHCASIPRSTGIQAPVMPEDSLDARKAMTFATSWVSTKRFTACWEAKPSITSSREMPRSRT